MMASAVGDVSPLRQYLEDTAKAHLSLTSPTTSAEEVVVVTTPDTKPNEPTVTYHLNDYVYIETSKSEPFEICQIDGIVQKRNGAFELQVRTLLRRQDVPIVLILGTEKEYKLDHIKSNSDGALHELYWNSSHHKSYAPHQLRGKCVVVRFEPEIDDPRAFVGLQDTFFYRLKYKFANYSNGNASNNNGSSTQQPFLYPLDEGSMRVGHEYQAVVPPAPLSAEERVDHYKDYSPEELRYTPEHQLTDAKIDKFISICRSAGTQGRTEIAAYLYSAAKLGEAGDGELPSLPNALEVASVATRDYTTECAMDVLHQCNYDIDTATDFMAPGGRQAICMEDAECWTQEEVARFREGFEKVGKNFRSIRQQFLPDKELASLVTFYYKWKRCGRFTGPLPASSKTPSPPAVAQTQANGGSSAGGGGGNRRVLYGKSTNNGPGGANSAALTFNNNHNNNNNNSSSTNNHRPGGKRKLKSIAIPERHHNTDSHALSGAKSRRCDSCLQSTLCRNYPCGMIGYSLCPHCRTHWQRMASFRIL